MKKWLKSNIAWLSTVAAGLLILVGVFTDAKQGLINWYEHDKSDHEKIESVDKIQQQIKNIQDSAITYYIPQLKFVADEAVKIPGNSFRTMILIDAMKGLMPDTLIYGVRFKYDNYKRIWYFKGNYMYSTQDNAEAKARFYRDINEQLKKCE